MTFVLSYGNIDEPPQEAEAKKVLEKRIRDERRKEILVKFFERRNSKLSKKSRETLCISYVISGGRSGIYIQTYREFDPGSG